MQQSNLYFYDYHPRSADFFQEVIDGLEETPKSIPPKFFYDHRGSQLFEEITRLPEYYLTRTETAILQRHAGDIASHLDEDCVLVEPGSGSSAKVRILLEEARPAAYMPVEISREHLRESASDLADDFEWLDVHAACADFTQPMDLPEPLRSRPATAFFPGSTIGNFEPEQARKLLHNFFRLVGGNGSILIGVDLKKDEQLLQAAYDDSLGVTAQFNLNLLTRINRELAADFNLQRFFHRAMYNDDHGRMESYLVSSEPQSVNIGEREFHFSGGEAINTEYSYKYRIDEFHDLAADAGLTPREVWTDEQEMYSLHLLEGA